MCIDPGLLADGTEIACRICWQCRQNKVDDWVGRCIAETKTAGASFFCSLTYGRDIDPKSPTYGESDHFRSAWLTYSDMQAYFKYLRRYGYKFRYLVAGEYGHMKGRAHWHAMLFFKDKVPPHELTVDKNSPKMFNNQFWPHGHQLWMTASEASARYVCKYINKDIGVEERQAHLSMSKKPPIGDTYFRLLAQKYVDAGLSPQDLFYSFPEIKDYKTGLPKKYLMRDTTAYNFLEYYKAAWKAMYPKRYHPYSEVIENHDDKIAREEQNNFRPEQKISIPDLPIGARRWYEGVNPITGFKGIYADDDMSIRFWLRKSEEGGFIWLSEEEMNEEKIRKATAYLEGRLDLGNGEIDTHLLAQWMRSALRSVSG